MRYVQVAVGVLVIGASQSPWQVYADEPAGPGFFQQLAEAIEDVVEEVVGPRQPAMRFVAPGNVPQAIPEGEIEDRKERLEHYLQSAATWVDAVVTLTPEQKQKLDEFHLELVTTSQENFVKSTGPRDAQKPLTDFAPIRFVGKSGAGYLATGYDWIQFMKTLLDEDQQRTFQTALLERQERLRDALIGHLVNQIDEELFLTADQREEFRQEFIPKMVPGETRLFSLNPQNYYIEYESLENLLSSLPDNVFRPAQLKRFGDLVQGSRSGNQNEQYVTFMANEGVDGWQKKLEELHEHQQKRLKRSINVRIEFWEATGDLSEEDLRVLNVAGRGCVVYILEKWKKTHRASVAGWEETVALNPNVNFGFSIQVPETSEIDSHQLWVTSLDRCIDGSSEIDRERSAMLERAAAEYLVSLLDRELWLTEVQFQQLVELMLARMPRTLKTNQAYIQELILLTVPIANIDEAQWDEILNERQEEALEALRGHFQFQGDYVSIQMRNMGQFQFVIPR
ncbi:hypothetical protein AB1L42_01855 [Thalassoglobus sp. JC818]|uniref:hypothetical protein n=1 Tax=Thalassoglobus sp. JC818 TaxID=3232136 RepID=UPI00345A0CEE